MHTSIGRLIGDFLKASDEDINDGSSGWEYVDRNTGTPVDHRKMKDFLRILIKDVPHYVIDTEVLKLALSDAAAKSINAMISAGIHQLPFDPILLEFMAHGSHCFVRLQSTPLVPLSDAAKKEQADIYTYPVNFRPDPDMDSMDGREYTAVVCNNPVSPCTIKFTPGQSNKFYVRAPAIHSDRRVTQALNSDSTLAVAVALLLLNTQGIDKVHVDTGKLNKARAKQGKQPIRSYTILHIGHVYDRHGGKHAYTGRHMPVHFRAGHVRHVWWGTGRTKQRPVYIQPCLVNYKPEEGGPKPKLPAHEVVL